MEHLAEHFLNRWKLWTSMNTMEQWKPMRNEGPQPPDQNKESYFPKQQEIKLNLAPVYFWGGLGSFTEGWFRFVQLDVVFGCQTSIWPWILLLVHFFRDHHLGSFQLLSPQFSNTLFVVSEFKSRSTSLQFPNTTCRFPNTNVTSAWVIWVDLADFSASVFLSSDWMKRKAL